MVVAIFIRKAIAMKKTNYTVSVDKLRVCLNAPTDLYGYLKNHYTRRDSDGYRILDEDDFTLTFIEEDEQMMRATLDVRDVGCFYRLGTFTFHNSAKYEGRLGVKLPINNSLPSLISQSVKPALAIRGIWCIQHLL